MRKPSCTTLPEKPAAGTGAGTGMGNRATVTSAPTSG